MALEEFYEHFKVLASDINGTRHGDFGDFLENFDKSVPNEPRFPELDVPISRNEILNSIGKLKRNKACGPDLLLNEYFIESAGILIGQLEIF